VSPRAFPVPEILERLAAAPTAIELLLAPALDRRRRARARPDTWSPAEVFAHVRACADVWGGHIDAILTQGLERIAAGDPRAWAVDQGYLDVDFPASFAAYAGRRAALLETLRSLDAGGWAASAVMVGAATRVERSVEWHAAHIARHEEQHVTQIRRTLRALATID
jgi:hypothetical protein